MIVALGLAEGFFYKRHSTLWHDWFVSAMLACKQSDTALDSYVIPG